MSEDNKELVRRYFAEVWDPANPANEEALRNLLSPYFKRHLSPLAAPLDLDGQIQRLAGIRSAFPNINFTIENLVAEGDYVVSHATLRGTHQGDLLGIPATGQDVTVLVMDVFRVEDGRFAEQWGGPDMLDLVGQIGGSVTPPSAD